MADNKDSKSEDKVETNVIMTQDQFQEMMRRISELEAQKAEPTLTPQPQTNQPSMNESGQFIGVTEKHSINPKDYTNPIEELYDLPQLKRYALRENFLLRWGVTPTRYQTAFGTWFVEPRFELTLLRKRFDEETGKERPDMIVMGRASFFEDLPANLLEAEQAGLSVDDVGTADFSNKMRMYRYTTWLEERLNPRRPSTTGNRKKLEVIGGSAYEVEEGNKVL
jgi:hypothetical protein